MVVTFKKQVQLQHKSSLLVLTFWDLKQSFIKLNLQNKSPFLSLKWVFHLLLHAVLTPCTLHLPSLPLTTTTSPSFLVVVHMGCHRTERAALCSSCICLCAHRGRCVCTDACACVHAPYAPASARNYGGSTGIAGLCTYPSHSQAQHRTVDSAPC